jgi:Uma2 family endonuclease
MTTISSPKTRPGELLELHAGDRMTREEFHRIYKRMPEKFKAELIGGTVYVASPLKWKHGTRHLLLGTLFGVYQARTAGVEGGDNTTILLGDEGEPQPDLYLRLLEGYGGQSYVNTAGFVQGGPEMLAEIAQSSRAIDLHSKRLDYARYGVLEYLVLCLRERQLRWFDLHTDQERQLDADGICRVRTFPGLWIHAAALCAKDAPLLLATLEKGLATPEHEAFVRRLRVRKKGRRASGPKRKR